MKLGTIVMCCIIIFLAWLQNWLPKKEKQFWSRGMSFCHDYHLLPSSIMRGIFQVLANTMIENYFISLDCCEISSKERECPTGFLVVRGECIDYDECKKHNGFCYENVHCMNTIGSYSCGCRSGYRTETKINWDLYINEPHCVDIDECKNRVVCPKISTCINTDGSFICRCDQGLDGDLCEDIDECSRNSTCDANAACSNTEGSFI